MCTYRGCDVLGPHGCVECDREDAERARAEARRKKEKHKRKDAERVPSPKGGGKGKKAKIEEKPKAAPVRKAVQAFEDPGPFVVECTFP